MSARGGELVATNKSTVVSKPILDAIVVEDGQSDRCFPNPPRADESNRGEMFRKTKYLLNQLLAPETGPRRWGR